MNEIGHIAGHSPEVVERFDTQYARSNTPGIVRFFDNCGLAPEYMAILGRHVQDIELVIEDPGSNGSQLTVGARQNGAQKIWHRTAILSRADLSEKKSAIEGQMKSMGVNEGSSTNIPALDWGFFELVGDMVANSVSMQQRFNRYSPDWNGQANCYLAQYAISQELFDSYGQQVDISDDEKYKANRFAIRQDHMGFRAGVGLELLRDSLVAHVTDKVTRANWIINGLRKEYYGARGIVPLSKHLITARLAGLTPTQPVSDMYDSIDRFFEDPEDI